MPTKHRRISVAFRPKVARALTRLSKLERTSLSHVTQELVEEALEFREDIYLSALAEKAEKKSKR